MNDSDNSKRPVDRRLDEPESLKVAQAVRAIPEDTPSLAWRSALNERILASAKSRRKRRRLMKMWVPAASLGTSGAAALLAFALWFGPVPERAETASTDSLEAQMVAVHRQNVGFGELAGPGLSVSDQYPTKPNGQTDVQWKEADLEAL